MLVAPVISERYNLEDFGWNEDLTLLYSRSENGTFQTWDATSGRILSDTETSPKSDVFGKTQQRISIYGTKRILRFRESELP
jgi:hypothetical protein